MPCLSFHKKRGGPAKCKKQHGRCPSSFLQSTRTPLQKLGRFFCQGTRETHPFFSTASASQGTTCTHCHQPFDEGRGPQRCRPCRPCAVATGGGGGQLRVARNEGTGLRVLIFGSICQGALEHAFHPQPHDTRAPSKEPSQDCTHGCQMRSITQEHSHKTECCTHGRRMTSAPARLHTRLLPK